MDDRVGPSIPGQAQQMTSDQRRQAHCTVWCIDLTSASLPADIAELPPSEQSVVALTKADAAAAKTVPLAAGTAIRCSSHSGVGLEQLAAAVGNALDNHDAAGGAVASTAARCADSITRAQVSLDSA